LLPYTQFFYLSNAILLESVISYFPGLALESISYLSRENGACGKVPELKKVFFHKKGACGNAPALFFHTEKGACGKVPAQKKEYVHIKRRLRQRSSSTQIFSYKKALAATLQNKHKH
jgi:hypothetical protein